MKKKVVFVGLSGGVDSAVSALLLKKAGFEVVGVFIKTWHPSFLKCNEEEERLDAMRVATFLNISFLTFDFEKEYKKNVADYMIKEYKLGRTPNPDVMCNQEIKFGSFLEKALKLGADCVATGHYAKNDNYQKNNFLLKKSIDPLKDQSYFLWTLNQEKLKNILFPVGNLTKKEVRKIALKNNLPVASKKDSQGICFLGDIDLKDFLKHYIKSKKGLVFDEFGKIIGEHNGSVFYTLGERIGFNIFKKGNLDAPYYVVDKNIKKNTLIVSHNKFSLKETNIKKNIYFLKNTNWIFEKPLENKNYTAQIRYHGKFLPCHVFYQKNKKNIFTQISFQENVLVAQGQSCVIYDGEICLGGGIIN